MDDILIVKQNHITLRISVFVLDLFNQPAFCKHTAFADIISFQKVIKTHKKYLEQSSLALTVRLFVTCNNVIPKIILLLFKFYISTCPKVKRKNR